MNSSDPTTCDEIRDRLVDYVEGLLEPQAAAQFQAHLDGCDPCRAQWQQLAALRGRLLRHAQQGGAASLSGPVMDQILRQTTLKLRRHNMFRHYLRVSLGLSTAAAAIILVTLLLVGVFSSTPAIAADVIADAAKAAANVSSVHIQARVRTLPADNFELIGVDYEFVPNELWWKAGPPYQYRVEKTGRVITMDGKEALLWIRSGNLAARGGPQNGLVGWMLSLLDVKGLLDQELRFAAAHKWEMTTRREATKNGQQLIVTVHARALGDFANPSAKNRSILESDNTRIWRFDADTKLLRALEIIVHDGKRDVTVFEITDIQYNQDFPAALFALDLPKDVTWIGQLPTGAGKFSKLSPKEVAQTFFQACADRDWDTFRLLLPMQPTDQMKQYLGGLKIVSIGEPFKSGLYAGWFVPYEIQLAGGETRKHNLAVRNDNPQKYWNVDGGF